MKINPVSSVVGQYQKLQTYTRKEEQSYSIGTDKLELSDQAKLFTEALSAARRSSSSAQVDKQSRLEELRSQLEDNTYFVDARDICKKMMMV